MKTSVCNGLNFTTKEINSNFKIKVAGMNEDGKKLNTLVGVAGLMALTGIGLVNKLIKKAFDKMSDKVICKLRRGLKITFYAF